LYVTDQARVHAEADTETGGLVTVRNVDNGMVTGNANITGNISGLIHGIAPGTSYVDDETSIVGSNYFYAVADDSSITPLTTWILGDS
jgi:hypothetical protein